MKEIMPISGANRMDTNHVVGRCRITSCVLSVSNMMISEGDKEVDTRERKKSNKN